MKMPRLGIAMAGLDADRLGVPADARALIEWSARAGFPAVQLNAAAPGLRPRELDRSARRDLAALLRRLDVACAGLDLWIPPEHFTDPAHADRAMTAVLGTVELAFELAGLAAGGKATASRAGRAIPAVCLTLPAEAPADLASTIESQAARCGVRVADHAWPIAERTDDAVRWLGVGVDPATVLSAGQDPAALAARLGRRVAAARVTDVAAAGATAGRVVPGGGAGRLDVLAYAASLAAGDYEGWALLDLRGVPEQTAAAESVRAEWPGDGG